jgi:hypothetical protein
MVSQMLHEFIRNAGPDPFNPPGTMDMTIIGPDGLVRKGKTIIVFDLMMYTAFFDPLHSNNLAIQFGDNDLIIFIESFGIFRSTVHQSVKCRHIGLIAHAGSNAFQPPNGDKRLRQAIAHYNEAIVIKPGWLKSPDHFLKEYFGRF